MTKPITKILMTEYYIQLYIISNGSICVIIDQLVDIGTYREKQIGIQITPTLK